MIHDSIDSILFPCPPFMVDAVVVRVAWLLLLLPSRPGHHLRAVAALRIPRLFVRRLFGCSVLTRSRAG